VKRVEWRPQARHDALEAAHWYARQGGLPLGERFLAKLDEALDRLAHHPGSGSARHAQALPDLAAPLRFVLPDGFERYLIYYLDLPTHVEVVRVWNAARGLDALMESEE
jgi:toxin ParE1/3/4